MSVVVCSVLDYEDEEPDSVRTLRTTVTLDGIQLAGVCGIDGPEFREPGFLTLTLNMRHDEFESCLHLQATRGEFRYEIVTTNPGFVYTWSGAGKVQSVTPQFGAGNKVIRYSVMIEQTAPPEYRRVNADASS